MLLAAGRRLEANQISRQEAHRHGGDSGREDRPERRQFFGRARVGQGSVVPSPRRGADRRSRSIGEVRDALKQLDSCRTAVRKDCERRVRGRSERFRIIEDCRVEEPLSQHESGVRQRAESWQIEGANRRRRGDPAQNHRCRRGYPAQDHRGLVERARTGGQRRERSPRPSSGRSRRGRRRRRR